MGQRSCQHAGGLISIFRRERGMSVISPRKIATGAVTSPIILATLLMMPAVPVHAGPADVKELLDQARTFEKAEDYKGAEEVYQQALSAAPDDPEVLKRIGVLYQTELRFSESIDAFQHALAASPGYPQVNFSRACPISD